MLQIRIFACNPTQTTTPEVADAMVREMAWYDAYG
jgi:hypothetical protein